MLALAWEDCAVAAAWVAGGADAGGVDHGVAVARLGVQLELARHRDVVLGIVLLAQIVEHLAPCSVAEALLKRREELRPPRLVAATLAEARADQGRDRDDVVAGPGRPGTPSWRACR